MADINDARKAVYNEFITQWGATSVYTLENEPWDEPNNTPWVRLIVKELTGGQETLGRATNRQYERVGAIMAQVFVPPYTGTKVADTLSKQLANLFEGKVVNDVVCNNAVTQSKGIIGKWHQTNVDIDIQYFETK